MGAVKKFINYTKRFNESIISGRKKGMEIIGHLKELNQFILYQHLKMEGLYYPKFMLQQSNCIGKLDLKDAYFSVPLYKYARKFLNVFNNRKISTNSYAFRGVFRALSNIYDRAFLQK